VGTPPPPRVRSKAEAEFLVRFKKLDILADAVHLIVPWGSLVAVFWFTYLMVAQLAGKATLADIGIKVMGDIKLPQVLAYLFGVSGVGYGMSERRLRRKKVEHMGGHIKALEEALDPTRSSSGLTRRGTTRPEDRI